MPCRPFDFPPAVSLVHGFAGRRRSEVGITNRSENIAWNVERISVCRQVQHDDEHRKDGLYAAPPYLAYPEFRRITTELAELAVNRGIDVNLAIEPNGTTLLHEFVLLRDSKLAVEAVTWLLAPGADTNLERENGETPLSLALKFDRAEIVELFRHSGRQ